MQDFLSALWSRAAKRLSGVYNRVKSGSVAERLNAPVLKTVVGSVAEWSIALVLKTSNGQPFVSSNLTASANKNKHLA
jgi:hypothetical protein